MIEQIYTFFNMEMIYLWLNTGVLPFWFMIALIPNNRITLIFVNSIILPLNLASAYCYTVYQSILLDEAIIDIFKPIGIAIIYPMQVLQKIILIIMRQITLMT